jgi:hypothetical protein
VSWALRNSIYQAQKLETAKKSFPQVARFWKSWIYFKNVFQILGFRGTQMKKNQSLNFEVG